MKCSDAALIFWTHAVLETQQIHTVNPCTRRDKVIGEVCESVHVHGYLSFKVSVLSV